MFQKLLAAEKIIINGKVELPNLPLLIERIEREGEILEEIKPLVLCLTHGDEYLDNVGFELLEMVEERGKRENGRENGGENGKENGRIGDCETKDEEEERRKKEKRKMEKEEKETRQKREEFLPKEETKLQERVVLFDIRGTNPQKKIDVVYDLGKIAHSFFISLVKTVSCSLCSPSRYSLGG